MLRVPRVAGVEHLAGGYLQRREQGCGAGPDVAVAAFGWDPGPQWQDRRGQVTGRAWSASLIRPGLRRSRSSSTAVCGTARSATRD